MLVVIGSMPNADIFQVREDWNVRDVAFADGINNSVTTTSENKNDDFAQKGTEEVVKGVVSNPGDLKKLVQL